MDERARLVPQRDPAIAWVGDSDRVVLLDPRAATPEPVSLEGSAATIWVGIDGVRSVEELLEKIALDFGVSAESVRGEIAQFVSELHARHLLTYPTTGERPS